VSNFSSKFNSYYTCTDNCNVFSFIYLLGESSEVVLASSHSIHSFALNWSVVGKPSAHHKNVEVKSPSLSIRLKLNKVSLLLYIEEAALQKLEFACIALCKVGKGNDDLVFDSSIY
jgi:hypothetical protein